MTTFTNTPAKKEIQTCAALSDPDLNITYHISFLKSNHKKIKIFLNCFPIMFILVIFRRIANTYIECTIIDFRNANPEFLFFSDLKEICVPIIFPMVINRSQSRLIKDNTPLRRFKLIKTVLAHTVQGIALRTSPVSFLSYCLPHSRKSLKMFSTAINKKFLKPVFFHFYRFTCSLLYNINRKQTHSKYLY